MDGVYENPMNSEQTFATQILKKWAEVVELSERYRVTKVMKAEDADIVYPYASMLCAMWGELRPEVLELKANDAFIADYNTYEPYYYDTQQLIDETERDEEVIYKFHMVLKMAIKKLGFTIKLEGKK